MFDHLDFFRLVERNHHVVEVMSRRRLVGGAPADARARREGGALGGVVDVAEEVRMIAALGAVTGFDDWAPTLLKEAPAELLQAELVASTRGSSTCPRALCAVQRSG